LQKKRGHANDPTLGIQNRRATGSLGDGSTDLQDIAIFFGQSAPSGNDSFGQGSLQPKGASDDGHTSADLSGVVGREGEKRKIFPLELEEGQIVARVGRDDSTDWKKTPIFRFGDDGVSLGDDVLIGNQETLSRNQEASAGGDRFSVLVL